jgi:hypothetical protein
LAELNKRPILVAVIKSAGRGHVVEFDDDHAMESRVAL